MDEAIDLICTLPDGSSYASAISFARSWSKEERLFADLRDDIRELFFASRGVSDYPKVVRPEMLIERAEDAKRAKRIRQTIQDTKWKDVEGGD